METKPDTGRPSDRASRDESVNENPAAAPAVTVTEPRSGDIASGFITREELNHALSEFLDHVNEKLARHNEAVSSLLAGNDQAVTKVLEDTQQLLTSFRTPAEVVPPSNPGADQGAATT